MEIEALVKTENEEEPSSFKGNGNLKRKHGDANSDDEDFLGFDLGLFFL